MSKLSDKSIRKGDATMRKTRRARVQARRKAWHGRSIARAFVSLSSKSRGPRTPVDPMCRLIKQMMKSLVEDIRGEFSKSSAVVGKRMAGKKKTASSATGRISMTIEYEIHPTKND